jgi:peptide/nickel transport system permease protein
LLGVTLFVAAVYVFVNLMVDIVYGILDPRIRIS